MGNRPATRRDVCSRLDSLSFIEKTTIRAILEHDPNTPFRDSEASDAAAILAGIDYAWAAVERGNADEAAAHALQAGFYFTLLIDRRHRAVQQKGGTRVAVKRIQTAAREDLDIARLLQGYSESDDLKFNYPRRFSTRKFGRLLARAEGIPIDGYVVQDEGEEIHCRLWRVMRG
jgi:hypothetical protein